MAKQVFLVHLFVIVGAVPMRGYEGTDEEVGNFVTYYHRNPDRERVPAMLHLVLKSKILHNQQKEFSGTGLIIANAFGHIARGDPKLVRLYESHFPGATHMGRCFLVDTLRICGDDATRRHLQDWSRDPAYANEQKPLHDAAAFLADPKRQLPRDRPAVTPVDVDILWADFLVTGEYPAIARILDILDHPGNLREKLSDWLKKNKANQQNLAQLLLRLAQLNLIEPGTKDKLVEGDLDLIFLHDAKGRIRQDAVQEAAYLGKHILNLSDEELNQGLLLQASASWSLQTNLKHHPRLAEHLKKHYKERASRSQELVKKWLHVDQPKVVLDQESQRLQGTWQPTAYEEDGDLEDPKVTAECLKFMRWKFEDDELLTTKAFTITTGAPTDPHTKVKGEGATDISTYKIDPSKSPKQMILTASRRDDDGRTVFHAIYELKGDVLRVCISKNDQMPKEFSGKKGSDCILVNLKKVRQENGHIPK